MIKSITIHVNILRAPEESLTVRLLPGGTDWLTARRAALRAIEDVFDRLSYYQVFQVTVEQEGYEENFSYVDPLSGAGPVETKK